MTIESALPFFVFFFSFRIASPPAVSCDFSKLTALVTTSSPKATGRLLQSMARYSAGMKALVASGEQLDSEVATAVGVPDLQDVNSCRNALLARVRTPYVLLLDDSIELSKKSQVGHLLEPIAGGEFDLVAGDLQRCSKSLLVFTKREPTPSHGNIQVRTQATGDQIDFKQVESSGKDALPCDFAQSFYVARTDKLRALGGWSSESPFDEREEFFLRAKRFGLQVGVRCASVANLWAKAADLSSDQRAAKIAALSALGVSQLVDCEGNRLEVASTPLAQVA